VRNLARSMKMSLSVRTTGAPGCAPVWARHDIGEWHACWQGVIRRSSVVSASKEASKKALRAYSSSAYPLLHSVVLPRLRPVLAQLRRGMRAEPPGPTLAHLLTACDQPTLRYRCLSSAKSPGGHMRRDSVRCAVL
jgi:hypothetical protein